MKHFLLITVIISCCLNYVSAQETFQKSVGGTGNDIATSVAQTTDGGYVLAGDTYSFDISKSDMYIVKFDSHGNMLWNKRYGGRDYDHANSITATSDGGCAIGGISGGNNNSVVIIKIDAAGNLEWSKFYSANTRHNISTIKQTPDGGYVLGGSASTYNNGSWGYVIKTDAGGNLEWSKLLFDRSFYPGVQKLVVTKDSGYAVVVNQSTTNAYYDIFLIKLKKNGNFEWAKSIGDESTDYPSDLIQTSDGGYAVAGFTFDLNSDPQYSFMYVFKTDSAGNFKFAKRIKGTNTDISRTIAETNDKQLIISGSIPSAAGTAKNIFVTKIDTLGNILWTKVVANDLTSSEVSDMINTADGGYAAAGNIGNSGATDFLLAHFDDNVNICGAVPGTRDDSDFGNPKTQTVNVSNATTSVTSSAFELINADGIYTSICDILPVKLISFTAAKNGHSVLLEWVTAQETNTKSFEAYKSVDGINYRVITTVAAHGNTGMQSKYNYIDEQPAEGKNFYKLKVIDKDSKYVFSEIRIIDLNNLLSRIFPNPAKDWLNIELNTMAGNLSFLVYSTDGKIILEKLTPVQTANNKQSIDIRSLKAGTYILQVSNGNLKAHYLFVKD